MSTFRRIICIQAVVLGLAVASQCGAQNAVVAWHAIMESTVAGGGRKNAVALPYYAYVDVAMYDAVNSIGGRFKPFAVKAHAPPGTSRMREEPSEAP